ncbi:fructosamine kinase family protein [Actinoplanes derwentensis]|uniref:Fructosamine-3-kinase n=1 Tax=Actinoplanes derwentensis TaxID=113562 RepID=A0A1H2CTS9_9ACTN|nr:fructosamine kinase family protein [Actinoplanes derwentensis]GID81861.1 fructosamine kinase [Actinoplanes derwentensis]SDT73883.1 Fructosamine-3-kinase [Actinoplanes derwentensis]
MDLAYLRAHPQHLPTFLTHQRIRETPVGGGGVCTASRLTLDDGASLFAKTWPGGTAPDGMFPAEAAGLDWLRDAGGVPVPEVIVALPDLLALEWIEPGEPSRRAAERFGRELAETHRAGADRFGLDRPGFIGPLPLDNTPDQQWGPWFAARRLAPYLEISADRGALSGSDIAVVEEIIKTIGRYGGEEPPARIHGDLWPGNVLWGADGRVRLVDPAAHGGHRETDLATLALFGGVPHLDLILASYQETWPLADGWRDRVPLHQLHLLLVHTAAFGSGYRAAVLAVATALSTGRHA